MEYELGNNNIIHLLMYVIWSSLYLSYLFSSNVSLTDLFFKGLSIIFGLSNAESYFAF